MFDLQLIKDIIECNVPDKVIKDFLKKINNNDSIELENSFETFYDLKYILNTIEKYNNNEIDENYLAHWANAYNQIIMDSPYENTIETDFLKTVIQEEISWDLDGLSFFDYDMVQYLDNFVKDFCIYDKIYNSLDNWKIYYDRYDMNEVYLFCINDKEKCFVRLYYNIDSDDDIEYLNTCTMGARDKDLVKILKKNNYTDLNKNIS